MCKACQGSGKLWINDQNEAVPLTVALEWADGKAAERPGAWGVLPAKVKNEALPCSECEGGKKKRIIRKRKVKAKT